MVHYSYWQIVWRQFRRHKIGMPALVVILLFAFVGIYAPFFASSKPFVVFCDGKWFFPFFRYLFFTGFYTKRLDIFYNLLMFTLPLFLLAVFLFRRYLLVSFLVFLVVQTFVFLLLILRFSNDPASDVQLNLQRQKEQIEDTWDFELRYMNDYARLNMILHYKNIKEQHEKLKKYFTDIDESKIQTLWQIDQNNEKKVFLRSNNQYNLQYIKDRKEWLENNAKCLKWLIQPTITFHWQDDAGGNQQLNKDVDFFHLTRINRKDFISSLLFGIRISFTVGLVAVFIALCIGIVIGSLAGYYGGKIDIVVCRLIEIWESMPSFFMLLLVISMMQSKSVFLVIAVIGIFGWTSFARFIRGEVFKQRNLPYIESCRALGFCDRKIIFSHILPNAIPPILTLLPFAIMAAITSEAGLSFLGLGEEQSCSFGVLMDEGRRAFPGESYLLWPPAIMLTILLVAIALVGDALRDAFDPKMH